MKQEPIKTFSALAEAMEPRLAPMRAAEEAERRRLAEARERREAERRASLRRLGVKVIS